MATAQGLIDYIWAGTSPFHCVQESARLLEAAGYVRVDDGDAPGAVEPGDKAYMVRSGSLIAWHAGNKPPAEAGFRLLGAHTDSPNLRLKPQAEYVSEGFAQWGIEPYGGVLLATWGDRDLGLSGRVVVNQGGALVEKLVRVDRPLARVTNLAIHLNRTVNDNGLILNKQKHLPPLLATVDGEDSGALLNAVLRECGVDPDAVVAHDLMLHDTQKPAVGGINGDFIFAPRLDNQASCYCALDALLSLDSTPDATAVITLFDHEEVGSGSERGAASALIRYVLRRLEHDHTQRAPGGLERATANSFQVSADMSHAVHPNYADLHDKYNKPRINGGPVVKTNVNMRYSTDAETSARFKAACAALEIPVQDFVVRSDLACGSTIGPISAAQLAIRTVDVGGAMLSMHSIREMCGSRDIDQMAQVMRYILQN